METNLNDAFENDDTRGAPTGLARSAARIDQANGKPRTPRVGFKTAVVTGASAGVGRATAIELARRGYAVALLARGRAGLEGARRDLEALQVESIVIACDVADDAAVFAAADLVAACWGRIDIWINCAMATIVGPVECLDPGEIRRVTEVSYLGAVYGTMAALRHMQRRGSGTIVQVGSALAYRSVPLQAPYCGAKHALRGFTDGLRTELIHDRSSIRLTMVQLPGINTPQFDWATNHFRTRHQPVGTIYEPEAVAAKIVDAAERGVREAWIGLPAIQAILGSFAAPAWLDRFLARTAYEPQISAVPVARNMEGNLFRPQPGDRGSRGRFSDRAKNHVVSLDPTLFRIVGSLSVVVIIAGLVLARIRTKGMSR